MRKTVSHSANYKPLASAPPALKTHAEEFLLRHFKGTTGPGTDHCSFSRALQALERIVALEAAPQVLKQAKHSLKQRVAYPDWDDK
jgi:hypothetical protein